MNILANDQIELSQRFARSGPDKFDGVDCQPGLGGAPLLPDVAASFECRCVLTQEGGDHLILFGEVDRYNRYDRQPLLFAKGRYAVAVDHPDTRTFNSNDTKRSPGLDKELVLSNLMIRAYSAIAARLEQGRKSSGLGLTLMQARLLRAASSNPDRTFEELLPELFLDFNASRNILESVVGLGLVDISVDNRVRLTPLGNERLSGIIEHARASEEVLFREISNDDLATVNRVLTRIVAQQN